MKTEVPELLGKKIGMTQVFIEGNRLIPVTVVEVGPSPIIQIKTNETDSYNAIQYAFGKQKEFRKSNALKGHYKKANCEVHQHLAEFRIDKTDQFKVGDVLNAESFQPGETVDVIGFVKGRGFQGVMKRWRHKCGRASHGSMSHRRVGSIGQRQDPGEVDKGKRMPGHMGTNRVTIQNLEVIKIFADKNLIMIKGSFPGANGDVVTIRKGIKRKQNKK